MDTIDKNKIIAIDGWQCFKIPLLMMKNLSFLKIKIVQNYS